MKKIIALLFFLPTPLLAQNKMGYSWVFGINGQIATFVGDTSRPSTHQLFWSGTSPNYPYIFDGGHSNICDIATGKLLFMCNGMVVYDTLGNIIENGDSLVPPKIYHHDAYPSSNYTQSSLIIPKGSNGLYYVFTSTVSDSTYNNVWMTALSTIKVPFDLLLYHIVDMNANGGAGKVIEKNKVLLHNVELHKTMMQACRHSNGVDWWLLKQGRYGTNEVIRFLVTKDSIYGPYTQQFNEPEYVTYDLTGQYAFNADGSKLAAVQGKTNKLFLSDFDRCTGELYNPKVYNVPIDSTTNTYLDSIGVRDSILTGVCFSPNNDFIYISKRWNLYQLEYNEPDSALAWFHIRQGPDTSYYTFEYYGQLKLGSDNRIYIGKVAGGFKQLSVIDKPDVKGVGCSFCRKCLRIDNGGGGSTSPPNMPDYTLGASAQVCWPLGSEQYAVGNTIKLYPNPASTQVTVSYIIENDGELILFNTLGEKVLRTQLLHTNTKVQLSLLDVANGIYHYEIIFPNQAKVNGLLSIQK